MGDQQVVGNGSHAQALCAGGARGNGGSGDLAQLPKESAGAADRQRDDHRLLPLRALPLRRYHLHQRMQAYSWRFRAPAADGGRGEAGASCRSGGRLFGGGERGKHGKKAIGWEEGGNGWVRKGQLECNSVFLADWSLPTPLASPTPLLLLPLPLLLPPLFNSMCKCDMHDSSPTLLCPSSSPSTCPFPTTSSLHTLTRPVLALTSLLLPPPLFLDLSPLPRLLFPPSLTSPLSPSTRGGGALRRRTTYGRSTSTAAMQDALLEKLEVMHALLEKLEVMHALLEPHMCMGTGERGEKGYGGGRGEGTKGNKGRSGGGGDDSSNPHPPVLSLFSHSPRPPTQLLVAVVEEMVARNVLASAIAVLPVKSLSRFLQFCSSAVRPPLRATHLPACNAPPCVHRTSLRASHLPACIAPPCLHRTSLRASHLPACIAPPCLHRLSVPLYPFSLCASQGSLCHCIPRHSTSLHSPTQSHHHIYTPAVTLKAPVTVTPHHPSSPLPTLHTLLVPHGGAGGGGGGAFLFISINLPTRFPFFSPPQFHMLAQVVGAEAHALAELQGFVLALLRAFTAANAISTAEADAIAAAAILEGGAVEDDVL
ncbi:unnamed protein product [Closterium sp. NIES-64]|nr:unnamed protein product [Closterium sp. NIES-64]